MKKKIIFVFIIIFLIILFIFIKIEYKKLFWGNNINESDSTNILNISSYEANIEMEVYSNKNKNKYKINQKYKEPNIFKQEIIEPKEMQGLSIVHDGEKVILENKALEIRKIYEHFKEDNTNVSLISFVNNYNNSKETEKNETEKEIILKTKIPNNKNKYQAYQNLYISKDTKLPTKMEILDMNQNIAVYILYNEIKINKTSKEEIL